ncbi:thermosome subunit alpha, partial [Sulfodiicoccus acidiphilus]
TTSAVVLAGLLLEKAERLLDQNVHPTIIIEGYKRAQERALEAISQVGVKVDVTDLHSKQAEEGMRKVVETTLSSKFMVGESSHKLVQLVIDAIRGVAERREDGTYNVNMDNVKIDKKKGGSLEDSALVRGLILDKEVVHAAMPRRVEKAKIAVVDFGLEVEKPEITAKISITSPEQIRNFLDEQTKYLKEMVDKLAAIGANVVVCQKGIDDVAQHFLAKKGIMAVRRVKRSDIEKLEKAIGARIISSVKDAAQDDLGYADLVEERKVGNDKMVFIEGVKKERVVNVLLRGSNDMAIDEAERSINDALHALRNLLRNPSIVAGGGAVEEEVSYKLRQFATQVGGKEQLAVQAYAEAVEEMALLLAETAGLEPVSTLVELRNKHSKGLSNSGVDVMKGKLADDMIALNIVDPVRVKEQVIKSATEAATAVLKIDDIIAAAPTKAPQGGGGGPEAGGGMPGMGGFGGD